MLMALAEAVLGLVQYGMTEGGEVVTGTYANRNHFAGLLAMSLPFLVALAAWRLRPVEGHRKRRPAVGATVAACLLLGLAAGILCATLLSLSRMGFLSALAALGTTGLLILWARVEGRRLKGRWS